ncbi:MAG TPA: hypothetical protein VNN80_02100 [Polyangiaceae bacterium]|nr:hypothetical protein [Polyangiaceae bacterium]
MTVRATSFALVGWLGGCVSCTSLLDLYGYSVAPDAGASDSLALPPDAGAVAPATAAFDHYRFARGEASFSVAAVDGLLANDTGSEVVAGSFATRAGGGIDFGVDGSFRYTPPGSPGAFWGDDLAEYEVVGEPPARARVRLTVAAPSFDLGALNASRAGFGIGAGTAFDNVANVAQGIDAAGDVNGDGFEDIIVGVPGPSGGPERPLATTGRGAAVIFGKADSTPVSLADLGGDPPKGFALVGDDLDYDSLGFSVAGAGDVNGDGLDDVIVSQFTFLGEVPLDSDPSEPLGASYVVFGKRDGASVEPSAIRAGLGGGFLIVGPPEDRYVGLGVSAAGDVNGDGLDDVMVSAPVNAPLASGMPGSGTAYVVFGQVGTAPVQLGALADEGRGFEIQGELPNEALGTVLSGVGDVNGDVLDDVAVISAAYPEQVVGRGRTSIVFGKRDTSPIAVAELASDPTRGFVLYGADDGDLYLDARKGGDINGDGFDDVLIGAQFASVDPPAVVRADAGATVAEARPQRGVTYVMYGSPNPVTMSLRDLEQPTASGFAVGGGTANRRLGVTVASGDIDADGFADVLMGTEPTLLDAHAFVLLGAASTPALTLPEPGDPARVLEITGAILEGVGRSVASADVNADGLDDLIVGAIFYPDAPQNAGGAYVAFGWDISDSLGERERALIGGADDNLFELPPEPIVIARGGNGTDTLRLGPREEPLDLRERGRYQSIEVIDARGGGPQVILLDDAALRRIPQNLPGFAFSLARRLAILGDAEDTLRFDMTGYVSRGGSAGRAVYGRAGRYYGLEVSRELRIEAP